MYGADDVLLADKRPAHAALKRAGVLSCGSLMRGWAAQVLDAAASADSPDSLWRELGALQAAADLTPNADGCRVLIADSSMADSSPSPSDAHAQTLVGQLARVLACRAVGVDLDSAHLRVGAV